MAGKNRSKIQKSSPKNIWVISGTHWDREWRYTADQSLLRLAELMDELLVIVESNPDFTCFHLDGGTIVIEDYLTVRPENEERLRCLMQAGRIVTVPWYTLPEMNTVSPESLIRNLLVGKRMADDFGGAMKTGYTATSYGQISQLPQIYAGFGLNCAMTYRGTNKHQVPPLCLWEGADGTRIAHIRCFDEVTRTNWFFFLHYELVLRKSPRDLRIKYDATNLPVHMADDTLYEVAFQLKHEDLDFENAPDKVRAAIRHFAQQAEPQAIADHLLALDMEDNAVPYVNLPTLIQTVNSVQDDYQAQLAALDEYVENAVSSVDQGTLPVLKGEMRYAAIEAGFNGLLGATHSSRILLKLLNHEAETDLIAVAEPLSTMSALMGGQYWRSLLDRAWLKLLKCHPHDSICGAAIDEAHDDMPSRFRDVRMIARETSRKACEDIWEKLDTLSQFQQGDLTITFFNPLPFERRGVIPAVIDTPVTDFGDIYIEPCSGAGPILEGIDVDELITYNYFDIVDERGCMVPHKVLEKENLTIEVERKLDSNAIVYNLERHRMLLDVEVPALGYRTYALRPRKRQYVTEPLPGADRVLLAQPNGILENAFLRVQIQPNGTFDMTDKVSGKTFCAMHYFADDGSVGNAHMHKSPLRDTTTTSLGSHATLTLMENNALRGVWRIDLTMEIPAEADLDARNRSKQKVNLPITVWLTLKKDSKRLEIKTRIENKARDHRLRVLFPTDIQTNTVDVESAFDVVQRNLQWLVTKDNHEKHYPIQPMTHFLDLSDGTSGVALLTQGLHEYEILDDPQRTIALTLLRSHRAYMLANRGLMTPEEYERNTGQHSIGTLEMEYALYPHCLDWRNGQVAQESEDFKTPWRIIQGVPKPGTAPVTQSLIGIEPADCIRLSALCQTEDGEAFLLRVWNSSDEKKRTRLTLPAAITQVEKIRMDESETLEEVTRKNGKWSATLRGKEIATFRLSQRTNR